MAPPGSVGSAVPAVAGEAVSNQQIETAETLIGAARFFVIFLAARALAELMVRLRLPTILGELVASACRPVGWPSPACCGP